jgi:hypothetical protein
VAADFDQLFGHPAADLDYWMTKPDKRHLFQKDWFSETGLRTARSHLAEFSGLVSSVAFLSIILILCKMKARKI